MIKKIKRCSRSRTIKWGHFQVLAGAISTGLTLITPATLPNLPAWVYGISLIVSGMITYVLRSVTRTPLEDKQENA